MSTGRAVTGLSTNMQIEAPASVTGAPGPSRPVAHLKVSPDVVAMRNTGIVYAIEDRLGDASLIDSFVRFTLPKCVCFDAPNPC